MIVVEILDLNAFFNYLKYWRWGDKAPFNCCYVFFVLLRWRHCVALAIILFCFFKFLNKQTRFVCLKKKNLEVSDIKI